LTDARKAGIGVVATSGSDSKPSMLIYPIHDRNTSFKLLWIILDETERVNSEITKAQATHQVDCFPHRARQPVVRGPPLGVSRLGFWIECPAFR